MTNDAPVYDLAPIYDLVGIGNALLDIVVDVEDSFLEEQGLPRGSMNLVDSDQSDSLYDKLPAGIEASGGSCGNTMAGFAALGGKGAYLGKVRDDGFGKVFAHDMKAIGVDCPVAPATDGPSTGRCLVMVSPDAQRTMATYLGAAVDLGPSDVPEDVIAQSKVLYMEGYLYDPEAAKQAFIKAATISHEAGRKVSLSLSDPFCVDRHRDAFRALVNDHIDILFGNEDEIVSLYQTDDLETAIEEVRTRCEIVCITRGSKPTVVLSKDARHEIDVSPVGDALTDTTGAGDQFAAGFLYGYTQGFDLKTCGAMGNIAGTEVVTHYGARPRADVRALIKEQLSV